MTKRYGEFEISAQSTVRNVSCGYEKCSNGYVRYMGTDFLCEACAELKKKAKNLEAMKKRYSENFDANLF